MMRKIFGVKNITHLLYGLILLLPFGMVFGRTIYTIANKNAKDSYYGENINEYSINQVTNNTQFSSTTKYRFINNTSNQNPNNFTGTTYYLTDVEQISVPSNYVSIFTSTITFRMYKDTANKFAVTNSNGNTAYILADSNNIEFNFKFANNTVVYSSNFVNQVYTIDYNKDSYLDNAFEYSLSQFTQDNNLGNVNFFSWFTNLFLDQTNAHNLVYLNFANWYMNYALLVSSGYLLFLCLLWFTNYVRRILDKSMNHDFGGF